MRKLSLLVFLLSWTCLLCAQQFGGNPPNRKWKQVNTDTARIIFPEGRDSMANRVASIVHYLAATKPASLGEQLKKINIVLQDQTVIPNGYVQLGPFRSEFFLTADPNNFSQGSIAWTDQLALHEYRHVQQFNNFRNGISKIMRVLFGEEGYALAINAAIPDWFYEGDATYNETILTRQGRGRLPLFMNAYPALWAAPKPKNYSWMKLRNGSFKDYVPSHYNLGYLFVNYGREKYGTDFWARVTKDASSYKGLFYPFQKAIKTHAGVDYKTFRANAFSFYKSRTDKVTKEDFVFPVKKSYVNNYFFLYSAGADSIIYLKSSYRHRPAFYLRDAQGEHKIRTRDISIDEQYSYRNGMIVYAAYENHPRWRWQDYSVIKLLDTRTGEQRKLSSKSKYFTPDISPSGQKVAAVQIAENGRSELHILDARDGKLIQAIHSAEINMYTDPKFIDEDRLVTAVRLRDGKMALATADINNGVTMRLTAPSFNVLGYPAVYNGVVYFTASYGGNDDVFAVRLDNQKIFRISNGPQGNYYANAGNGKITWSSFTAEGLQLKQINEKDIDWKEIPQGEADKLVDNYPFEAGKQSANILEQLPARDYPVTRYKKGTRLFNFHSWRPYYEDPIFTFSLYGENVLNTFQSELYYLYNENEKTSAVGYSGIYGGWFPYISFGTELTFDREALLGNRLRKWNQLDSRIGLQIPLQTSSGQTFNSFNANTFYVFRNEFNRGFFKDSAGNTSFSYLQHGISWNQQVQRALQDFYPRLGYFLSLTHRYAITTYKGYQFNGSASVFLPGFVPSHNIQLAFNFQQRDTLANITFGNRFTYSRGFTGRYFSQMWRLSTNYHLPLLYPDWGFANILYFERVRANLFFDLTKVYSRDKKTTADQKSIGGEIFIDTKWWNQYPLTFGFRVSRQLDFDQFDGLQRTVFEFVLPVSIIPR